MGVMPIDRGWPERALHMVLLARSVPGANFYATRDILAQLWQVIGKSSNRIEPPQVSSCFGRI
jgi:hypothetical protein